jgi:hypothetical protein
MYGGMAHSVEKWGAASSPLYLTASRARQAQPGLLSCSSAGTSHYKGGVVKERDAPSSPVLVRELLQRTAIRQFIIVGASHLELRWLVNKDEERVATLTLHLAQERVSRASSENGPPPLTRVPLWT